MTFREPRGATPEEDEAMGNFERGTITKVHKGQDGYTVSYGDSWGCFLRDCGVEPQIGDQFTTYGSFGRPFHGQALNGKVLWYDSIEQEIAKREAEHAEYEAKRKRAFADNMVQMDAEYSALPPAFKNRIKRFRDADPAFRWQSESYEMFCCTQAVLLADWARDGTTTTQEAIAKIEAWDRINSEHNDPPYDYQAQLAAVPGWSDAHSGNTHAGSVGLAKRWIRGDDL
jgi:hypothetical protein